jgi:hypothetical protein
MTRLDITFATAFLARYAHKPHKVHFDYIKRIHRYLSTTKDVGFRVPSTFSPPSSPEAAKTTEIIKSAPLVGFSDASFADDVQTRRSTAGYVIYLCGTPIAWKSTRQTLVTTSTTESEYVAMFLLCKEVVWTQQILRDLFFHVDAAKSTAIYCDNEAAMTIATSSKLTSRSKHIDIKYHYIRELHRQGAVQVRYVSTKYQLADILTKPLGKVKFHNFMKLLGLK